ncbi:neuronal acetylcholine receptor subunit alpha-7-like [Watersipora subatra]|uniref:neuronal acetylcholine receptor subunit alpha-7-like n=1 Tax=Watersipora subatra TaxID=2589382 RepID=UPI00355BF35A
MYAKIQVLLVAVHLMIQGIAAGPHEVRLINMLLKDYNSYERPAEIDNVPLKVEFQVTLRSIIDVHEKNQMINTNLWLDYRWKDYKLTWDPTDYGNITEIRLPQKLVWKPDILMYNSADPAFDGSYSVNLVVYSDGTITQTPPGIFTSSCPINIKWFPFDDQECKLKFGSWTYDGTKINLEIKDGMEDGSLDGYSRSGEWDLLGFPGVRNVVYYDCCPDNPYIDITYSINVRRRKLYYIVNIVTPCLMLAALTLVTFTIPPDAGEKISFGVTILLSLTVFLLMVAEALPASSDAVPLIAVYFSAVMLLNAASVVFTVLVLNYHHRTSETHEMPRWVKRGICEWLAWLLRIDRPGHTFTSRGLCAAGLSRNDLEMNETNNCKALLSNGTEDNIDFSPSLPRTPNLNGTDFTRHKLKIDAKSITSDFSPTRYELRSILKELKFITEKMKSQDEDDQVTSDWKFAAAVVDRFLLWFFAIATALASVCILLAAPHMFSSVETLG